MSANIYEQHKAAFPNVSAYVVLNSAKERVATVAFKYPRDGAGRLYCYLHVLGVAMVRGYASGCGYDKHGASIHVAARLLSAEGLARYPDTADTIAAFQKALKDSGLSSSL